MPAPNNPVETSTDTNKEKPPICVLAADSTRMNSQMLADVLARDKRFRVLETQISADSVLALAENEKADVVLLSPLLDGDPSKGFKLTRELRAAIPSIRVVMLLDRSERAMAVEAFRAGASGIFARSESLKFLPRCITCVHAGQVWANSEELKYLLDALAEAVPVRPLANKAEISVLSRREQEVVQGVADGLSNREIAKNLGLTEHTVKNYLFRIFDKLGVSSRVEVVLYAFGLSGAVPQHSLTMEIRERNSGTTGRIRKNPRPTGHQLAIAIEKDSRKALP
jgi:two-component system nitrate/nitrite response regulator NarL